MKLGSAHREGWCDTRLSDRPIAVPPGYRVIDLKEDTGRRQVWSAEAPGGFRVALTVVRRREGSLRPDPDQLGAELAAASHPNLVAFFGGWVSEHAVVLASEWVEGSLWDRFVAVVGEGARGIRRDELTELLAEAAKALDVLAAQPSYRGHDRLEPRTMRLVGASIKLEPPRPSWWPEPDEDEAMGVSPYEPPEARVGRPSALSDVYRLAAIYAHLRGGRADVPIRSGLADLSRLPEPERPSVARALSPDPSRRWPTCRAFLEALRADIRASEASGVATRPVPTDARTAVGAPAEWFRLRASGATLGAAQHAGPSPRATRSAPTPTPALAANGPTSARPVPVLRLSATGLLKLQAGQSSKLRVKLEPDDRLTALSVRVRLEGLPTGVTATSCLLDASSGWAAEIAVDAAEHAVEGPATARLVAAVDGAPDSESPLRIQVRPRRGVEARRRGEIFLRREALDDAIAAFDEALASDPTDAFALHGRGLASYGRGDHDRALADFDAAARLRPRDPSLLNNRGLARLARGEGGRAREDFEAALQLDPTLAVVHYNLGRSFALNDEPAPAVAAYSEAVRLDPNLARAFVARADARIRLGDLAAALEDYDEAARLRPDDGSIRNNRGLLQLKLRAIGRAIDDFDAAIALDPEYALARYNRGRAYARLGDFAEAIASFDQAIRIDPTLTRAFEARASASARLAESTATHPRPGRARRSVVARSSSPAPAPAFDEPPAFLIDRVGVD